MSDDKPLDRDEVEARLSARGVRVRWGDAQAGWWSRQAILKRRAAVEAELRDVATEPLLFPRGEPLPIKPLPRQEPRRLACFRGNLTDLPVLGEE